MFISKKILHELLQAILDYTLDMAQKSLETKDKTMRDVLNNKMRDTLDLSLLLTNKLYTPKMRRAKKTTDN
jgi:hypothetical protein